MPNMVTIIPTPGYKPKSDDKDTLVKLEKQWKDVKLIGPKVCSYVTALSNIRNSGGMYSIQEEVKSPDAQPAAAAVVPLEEMESRDLKVMMISLGVKTEKQMKREDIIKAINSKLDEIEVLEDEEDAE